VAAVRVIAGLANDWTVEVHAKLRIRPPRPTDSYQRVPTPVTRHDPGADRGRNELPLCASPRVARTTAAA